MHQQQFVSLLIANGVWAVNIGANAEHWLKLVEQAVADGRCTWEQFFAQMVWQDGKQPTCHEAIECASERRTPYAAPPLVAAEQGL